jgi:magnesium chelatase family protein
MELSSAARAFLGEAIDHLCLTARGFDRLLRVARTLADLSDDSSVGKDHLLNAMTFRLERSWVGEVA